LYFTFQDIDKIGRITTTYRYTIRLHFVCKSYRVIVSSNSKHPPISLAFFDLIRTYRHLPDTVLSIFLSIRAWLFLPSWWYLLLLE